MLLLKDTILQNIKQQLHEVFLANEGNRLTKELIVGMEARIELVLRQLADQAKEDSNKEV